MLKIVLPVLVIVAGIGVFLFLKTTKPPQQSAPIKERTWRVEVLEAQPARMSPTLTLYGRVESPNLFKAAAPAPAGVERVLVREGDAVTQGQLLVVLDERDFLPKVEQADAEATQLQALIESEEVRRQADREALQEEGKLLELARAGVVRARRLLQQKLGSDSALEEAEQAVAKQALALTSRRQAVNDHPARLKALQARLRKAESQLSLAQLDYERSRISAPQAGVIAQLQVAVGDQVKANDLLLSLYNPAELELRARIPAPFLSELQQSLASGIGINGNALIGADRVTLELTRFAGEASANGIDALFRIHPAAPWLRTGQVMQFSIARQPREHTVAVPYAAVYGSNHLYIIVEERLRRLQVEPLGTYVDANGAEKLLVHAADLRAGDRLVITHLPHAIDGLKAEAVTAP